MKILNWITEHVFLSITMVAWIVCGMVALSTGNSEVIEHATDMTVLCGIAWVFIH